MSATAPRFKRKFNLTPYLFLIVPFVLYLVWIIGPMLYTFYLSMTDWDGISPEAKYIGLKNFETLFGSLGKMVPSAHFYHYPGRHWIGLGDNTQSGYSRRPFL